MAEPISIKELVSGLPKEEQAKRLAHAREVRSFLNIPEGVYVLKEDWKNPFADKRRKKDWRAAVSVPKGTRFVIRHNKVHDSVETDQAIDIVVRCTEISEFGNSSITAGISFVSAIFEFLEKEKDSLGVLISIANERGSAKFSSDLVALLYSSDDLKDRIEGAINSLKDMSSEDIENLRVVNGFR